MRRVLTPIVIVLVLSIFGLEAMLRAFDPLGVVYFDDLRTLFRHATNDPTGYALPVGATGFHGWTLTVGGDGLRITPDAAANGPTVHFYGDSLTMCWGVNDGECWVNQLARDLGINARNYGRNAYNAANIDALIDATGRGHCAVFLTTSNDTEAPVEYHRLNTAEDQDSYAWRYFAAYVYLSARVQRGAPPEHPSYAPAMRRIADNADVLLLTFDDAYGRMAHERYSAVLIPPYTSRISFFDSHADAAGNAEIANAAAPIIADWLRGRDCR